MSDAAPAAAEGADAERFRACAEATKRHTDEHNCLDDGCYEAGWLAGSRWQAARPAPPAAPREGMPVTRPSPEEAEAAIRRAENLLDRGPRATGAAPCGHDCCHAAAAEGAGTFLKEGRVIEHWADDGDGPVLSMKHGLTGPCNRCSPWALMRLLHAEVAARPAPPAAPSEGELEALRALRDAGPSGSGQFVCAYCPLQPGRTKHARDCVWAAAREAARGEG